MPNERGDAGPVIGVPPEPSFREDLYRARELRDDWAFGEEILNIADNAADDWNYNPDSKKLTIQKEAILRSKIRTEARQFHMSRLHPQQWGETQQTEVRDDWGPLTEEERRRKADELIAMIRELREPQMQRPALVYPPRKRRMRKYRIREASDRELPLLR